MDFLNDVAANYTSSVSLDDFFRLNIVALEQAVRDPRTHVAGVCAIVDLAGFGLQHAPFVAPHYTRRTIDVVQVKRLVDNATWLKP